jgi:hypothetical protein
MTCVTVDRIYLVLASRVSNRAAHRLLRAASLCQACSEPCCLSGGPNHLRRAAVEMGCFDPSRVGHSQVGRLFVDSMQQKETCKKGARPLGLLFTEPRPRTIGADPSAAWRYLLRIRRRFIGSHWEPAGDSKKLAWVAKETRAITTAHTLREAASGAVPPARGRTVVLASPVPSLI